MECTHCWFFLIVTRLSSYRESLLEFPSFHLKFSNLGWVLVLIASWESRSWGSCQTATCTWLLMPAHLPCLDHSLDCSNRLSTILTDTRPCCDLFSHSCLEWFARSNSFSSLYCPFPSEFRGKHPWCLSPFLSQVFFHSTSSRVHLSQSPSSL